MIELRRWTLTGSTKTCSFLDIEKVTGHLRQLSRARRDILRIVLKSGTALDRVINIMASLE